MLLQVSCCGCYIVLVVTVVLWLVGTAAVLETYYKQCNYLSVIQDIGSIPSLQQL